jgi:PleD family two-component response regulator
MSAPRVLIVEGDHDEAKAIEEAIFEIPERENSTMKLSRRFWWNARIVHARTLAAGLAAVRDRQVDLVLLNPNLEDHQGVDSFRLLKAHAPDLPVILLLDETTDEQTGRLALREGAQDYLFKSRCDWESLAHSMENAMERSRLVTAFWKSFLLDPLTNLPNRTGFVYLAEMVQSSLSRTDKPLRMILTALDDDCSEQDVQQVAESLRNCVNDGDLTGRLSSSQFGVLSQDLDIDELTTRIRNTEVRGARPPTTMCWSYALERNAADMAEAVDQLIAGAEMLVTTRNEGAKAADAVH